MMLKGKGGWKKVALSDAQIKKGAMYKEGHFDVDMKGWI